MGILGYFRVATATLLVLFTASYSIQNSYAAAAKAINLATVNITVSDAPKLVELVEEFNHPEDTNASITCSVGSGQLQGLTFEWFKNKERLYGQPNKIRIDIPPDNYQSTLRIFDLKQTDSALYTCIARNRFGHDQISTKLNVKVQLKWSVAPSSRQVAVGKSIHIPCVATGNPEPKIEWRKIGDGSQQQDDFLILGNELRFSSIGQHNAGQYECRASNGQDEDLVSLIKLDVLGK